MLASLFSRKSVLKFQFLMVKAYVQYACRKTLADSRPRVRGRFAKNDDFGEAHRPACSNHEEDDDDEVRFIAHKSLIFNDMCKIPQNFKNLDQFFQFKK